MSDGGKGDSRIPESKPGSYSLGYDAIFGPKLPAPPPFCPVHRKPLQHCGCMPTDDGPGQGSDEVKTHYERRRFDREGV